MYWVLNVVILVIAALFLALAGLIAGNKVRRDWGAGRWSARRHRLEPGLERFLQGEAAELGVALGGLPRGRDRRVVEDLLIERAERRDEAGRERRLAAFERLGLVDEYLERLVHRGWWHRAEAAEKLGLAGASRAIPNLLRAMENDPNAEVRLRAARALGDVGGRAAIRPLVRALGEPSRWSTIRIADILGQMGGPVLDELIEAFPRMALGARRAAIDVIAAVGHGAAGPWLRERLGDPETDVRSRAAHALGGIGDLDAGPALIEALHDSQWPVRAMAAKALGVTLHLPAIEELCGALRDREWWVRSNAAEALRLMGPDGLDALERMLDDYDPFARHQAVLMLEESGMLDDEIGRLVDDQPDRRAAALSLVNRLVHAGQHGRLRELAERHPDGGVRRLLRALLPAEESPREAAP